MTTAQYYELKKEQARINKEISEYENEHRRGMVKLIHSRSGYCREKDSTSLRVTFNDDKSWHTITTQETGFDFVPLIETLAHDLGELANALKAEKEQEK